MADRTNVDKGEAEATVFDNLGMSPTDLGAADMEDIGDDDGSKDNDKNVSGTDDDETERQDTRQTDTGEDEDDQDPPQRQTRQQRDDVNDLQPRVSHTRPLPKSAEVRADAKGNLVNAQGQIVARAGKEARLYKERHQAVQRMQQLEQSEGRYKANLSRAVEIGQTLHSENEKLKSQIEGINKFGLQPNELSEAASMAYEAKSNPVGVLKKLLTKAAAAGIDLTQIGLQGGDAMKTLAEQLRQEISHQMKPLQDRNEAERVAKEQEQKQATQLRDTETHINEFFTENKDALPYVHVFKALVSNPQFSRMSLGEMWARIQLNLERQPRSNGQPNRRQPRVPNGRGGAVLPNQNSDIASPDKSYGDILKSVMDEQMPQRR